MDSRVRNLTIFIVVSIILLAFGLVALMNKEDKKKPTAAVNSQPVPQQPRRAASR